MDFTRLRLIGFKSFVEAAELRIEPGLTGVVGPNGCGKSNLLEAIRWVMGEGSPKSLRSGGMDDVIFAGTATRPSRDIAEVVLSLDNGARTAPAAFNDSDDIEVVRRIERGLGSAYRIGGREARLRDVQLLFADNATGAHSPALVGQGRIGAIIGARPDERRALLEEAAGISGLHVRRKEAEVRLRATEANLLRLDDVLAGMTAQVAALRRQARIAAKYAELGDRIRIAEGALLFARWQAAHTGAEAARVEAAAAETVVADQTRVAARLATTQAEHQAALPGLRETEAHAAAALQHAQQQRSALAAELLRVEARERELAAAAATGDRDRAREVELAADAGAALARLAEERGHLAKAIAATDEALPRLAQAAHEAKLAAEMAEAGLADAVGAEARAVAQARSARDALTAAEARLARSTTEVARLNASRAALDDGSDEAERRDAAQNSLDAAAAEIAAAGEALTAAEAGRRDADAAREAARAVSAKVRGERAALVAERDALVRVLAQGPRGGAGVIDLVTVRPGFEAALVAALGDDLSAALGAGARHWAATADADDPALPVGAQPLSEVVEAPAELSRRLRQVGVVTSAEAEVLAAVLAPGQRLVSTTGQLWRWDGFRSVGGEGRAAAERLVQRARLAAVESEIPGVDARVADADAATVAAAEALATYIAAETRARAARTAAEGAQAAARTALAKAAAALAARAAQRDAIDAALARLTAETVALAAEVEVARSATVPVADDLAAAVATRRRDAEAARTSLASTSAAQADAVRRRDADTARHAMLGRDAVAWEARAATSTQRLADLEIRAETLSAERAVIAVRPAEIASEVAAVASVIASGEAERRAAADALASVEGELRTADVAARTVTETLASAREARARAALHAEHEDARRAELAATCRDRFQTAPHALADRLGFAPGGDAAALAAAHDMLIAERERLGPVNLLAVAELAETEATLAASTAERVELDTAIARLRGSIGALNREGRVRLRTAFETVDGHFRSLFATLFVSDSLGGGAAHLELTDSDDPLAAGFEIMAQPPGKKLQSLTLLSGGEQALTAIALIFALFLTTPSPLCVLDEVDAPLDDANVERFCDLLDRMADTTRTRFLIVTHNAVTMSRMHRLYGVTMAEAGVSQLVSVDLARAEALVAP